MMVWFVELVRPDVLVTVRVTRYVPALSKTWAATGPRAWFRDLPEWRQFPELGSENDHR